MSLRAPNPLNVRRVRQLPKGFSWIDRRFLTDNFLAHLSPEEAGLYFFLVTAADRHGMSFYGTRRICVTLGLTEEAFHQALEGLRQLDLVEYRYPFFQVLSLPERPRPTKLQLQRALARRRGQ